MSARLQKLKLQNITEANKVLLNERFFPKMNDDGSIDHDYDYTKDDMVEFHPKVLDGTLVEKLQSAILHKEWSLVEEVLGNLRSRL